jgi:hypothetical protein
MATIIWWSGIIGLFLVAHIKIEYLLHLFQETSLSNVFHTPQQNSLAVQSVITPIRGILMIYSLTVLIHPILVGILDAENGVSFLFDKKHLHEIVLILILLFVIFPPGELNGFPKEFANTSFVMFSRVSTVTYHYRILLPALAHILFFRGDLFYLVFSFICTILFIFILRYWFENNKVQVSIWQFVSLGTLSFVYLQIQSPGYPDVLVNIFILLAFTCKLNLHAKLSLFALSLATHEGSMFMWFALALLLFDSKGLAHFLAVSCLYIALFLYSNDGIAGLLAIREVDGTSVLKWVLDYPLREIAGMFFGLKALWGIVIAAIVFLASQKRHREVFPIIAILIAGVAMTFFGVDTSRLFGWAFMAVLLGWKILENAGGRWKVILNTVLIINLLIPTVNVILTIEPYVVHGLYSLIFNYP